jgi:putative DNA primase/helicase
MKVTITPLDEILDSLLKSIQTIDFSIEANPEIVELQNKYDNEPDSDKKEVILKQIKCYKVSEKEKYVIIIDKVIEFANKNNWDICQNGNSTFVFNGSYWQVLDENVLKRFLGQCAEKLGLKKTKAKQYDVKDCLLKQFYSTGFRSKKKKDTILINLKNGTFEVTADGKHKLREVDKNDFLTYQLPFEYNPAALCPKFEKYINEVLQDKECQNALAEFAGYVFIPNLKHEKALFLYGSGANGKSVFFDIITALFGKENITNSSLSMLCKRDDYRAKLALYLVNYASEIGKEINTDIFKQLVSCEPITVRELYGKPHEISNYTKLIFNANELPKSAEQTEAYFRRFLIIPFDVTIPKEKRNPNLAREINANELSGIFNWVLRGLDRLVVNKKFTECAKAEEALNVYKSESNNVVLFIDECCYTPSIDNHTPLKNLYAEYRLFCSENGYLCCSNNTFSQRLKDMAFNISRRNMGNVVYIEKQ